VWGISHFRKRTVNKIKRRKNLHLKAMEMKMIARKRKAKSQLHSLMIWEEEKLMRLRLKDA